MSENEFNAILSAYKKEQAILMAEQRAKYSQSTKTQESLFDEIHTEPCLFSEEDLKLSPIHTTHTQSSYKSFDEIMEKRLKA